MFELGVPQVYAGRETIGHDDVDILVECGCDEEAPVPPVVGGQIGGNAGEVDAKRATDDYHVFEISLPWISLS
jgi:hypothetical protein